jgi:hypothetical protein
VGYLFDIRVETRSRGVWRKGSRPPEIFIFYFIYRETTSETADDVELPCSGNNEILTAAHTHEPGRRCIK